MIDYTRSYLEVLLETLESAWLLQIVIVEIRPLEKRGATNTNTNTEQRKYNLLYRAVAKTKTHQLASAI